MQQTSIVRAIGASTRIFELLERKPTIDPSVGVPVPSSTGDISFEEVSFAYPSRSQVEVLKDFHLKLNMGDNVAIVCVNQLLCCAGGVIIFIRLVQWDEWERKIKCSCAIAEVLRPYEWTNHVQRERYVIAKPVYAFAFNLTFSSRHSRF